MEGRFSEVQTPDRARAHSSPESLCTTTTCRCRSRGVVGLRSYPRASQSESFAQSCKRTSKNSPSETVWKFGVGSESELRKRPTGLEGVPIGRLLPPKKRAWDAFSYFPNSFSTHSG